MTVLINDPLVASQVRAEREASDGNIHDEVWDGVYVVSPSPNIEHQRLITRLWLAFTNAVEVPGAGIVCNNVNVSDRDEGWIDNYRIPDVSVFLAGNPAKNCKTHWCGGPDFAVEILSPNDLALEKFPFYARIGVRELMIIDRDPWALELFRLDAGRLEFASVGRSSLETPDLVVSTVLPLAFRLVPGEERPQIEVTRTDGAERWLV